MLVEAETKQSLISALQQCHEFRTRYFNVIMNVCVFAGVGAVGVLCYYLQKQNKHRRNNPHLILQQQEYILGKIRMYQDERQRFKACESFGTGFENVPPSFK